MPARTIDNLGLDASSRYAEDQKHLDEKIIKEARAIAPQTIIDVTQPVYPTEFEVLFELSKRNIPWAEFAAPKKYNEQKKRLFTHQTIPSLGSPDKKESQIQKIQAKVQAQSEKWKEEQDKEPTSDPNKKFLQERKFEQLEKEKKILMKLFDNVLYLDKDITDMNSRRTQYQRG